MTVQVRVTTNLKEFQGWISLAATKQIPFATALALTRTAKTAREVVVFGLPARFTVRGQKLAQSIRYKPANKRDWPRPSSSVYTLAEALVLQELGGTKRPRRRDLAIPGAGTRPTAQTTISKAKRPAAVLKRRGYFLGHLKSGPSAGADAILQRVGPDRYPLRVSYLLRPRGEVKPALGFADSVERSARSVLPGNWLAAMNEAFASSKKKR